MRGLPVALIPAGVALGLGSEWAWYETGELDAAVADLLAGWALLGCGLVAWLRRRDSRVGVLMVATGAAWFIGGFVPAALYLHRGPLVHLLLTYPTGRVTRRTDRVVVAAAYVDGAIEPLASSPVATLVLCAVIAIAAFDSYRSAKGPRRRARAVPTAGAAAIVLVLGFGAVARIVGAAPHPSTLGMALLAYTAQVELAGGGSRPVAAVYGDGSDGRHDHQLGEHEILTAVLMPEPLKGERAAYLRAISRATAEWPLVEAIVRLALTNGRIEFARAQRPAAWHRSRSGYNAWSRR